MAKYRKFDVFLSHNSRDKQQARELKQKLSEIRLRAWLDEDELRPGIKWQPALEDALKSAPSILVLIGPSGLGPWEDVEMQAGLTLAVKDGRPIFLVIYGADEEQINLPLFLSSIYGRIKIDQGFNERVLSQLRLAITGKPFRPRRALTTQQTIIPNQKKNLEADADYVLAEHAVQLFMGKTPEILDSEIFTNRAAVTRYVKVIINQSYSRQKQTIRAVKELFELATLAEKSQLAYLLGRLEDYRCKKEAAEILIDFLNQELVLLHGVDRPRCIPVSMETKLLLILERTICISLIYLGEDRYAEYYCERLLQDPVCDEINRGFHLEYYGDVIWNTALEHEFCADILSVSPALTFEVLVTNLEADVKGGRFRSISGVEAQTLVSICVNRHLYSLLTDSFRLRVLSLLNEILLSPQRPFSPSLASFLGSGRDLLDRSEVSVGSLFEELMSLKEVRRAGWNTSRVLRGRIIERICPSPESVADHIWGCLAIASAFLPDQLASEPEYRKIKVIEMISVHDLAEAWIGDTPFHLTNMETAFSESRIMERCAHLFRSPDLRGAGNWLERWKGFNGQSDFNAKVASDINRIETYLQLNRYSKVHGCVLPDADDWRQSIESQICTSEGQRILQILKTNSARTGTR